MSSAPDHDPSVYREPHMRARPIDLGCADRLEEEPARAGAYDAAPDELAETSVRDEPSLGWRASELTGVAGYADLLAERERATPTILRALVFVGLVLVAGPAAILGALWSSIGAGGGLGYLAVTVTGPVVEEMAKVAVVLWVVERKPWLIGEGLIGKGLIGKGLIGKGLIGKGLIGKGLIGRGLLGGSASIVATGLAGGVLFGAIENLIYLRVYFPDAGEGLAAWRWGITMPMHALCSTIAAVGVARMWRGVMRARRPARIADAFPWIVAAIVVHGAYNAFAVTLSLAGNEPS
ncbi:MAG: PrsW family intramembrane metalloprotease [Phycisphaera sp.]|nr:PrsW family intramembrane metalloprotease [Phycisphaera sp.]